ncbi:MAG: OB-fold nucleic acid binding domain-containing protein [Anaerolineae bacterium]|nr:OB-fold nucleic acid binding domain-containing protein [Anaerolineae bacterium]MDW8068218.1 OB-fold nucleic acid binding domain-containing protein [Anaerolineae bacterium]
MSHCLSCGRYIGPYETCPYCGARQAPRVSLRAVKWATLALATLGLALLWVLATRLPLPRISIHQASATMNFAYVEIAGQVVRGPTWNPDSRALSFTVADETGEMRVWAFRDVVDELRATGRVPGLGDRVIVAGTLRVREEDVSLTLNVPDHLTVIPIEPEERTIGSITVADALRRVRVRGQVWEVREPYSGLTLITLRDPTGAIGLAVDSSLQSLTGAFRPPDVGQSLEVTATVSLYRDTPQLVLPSVREIVLLEETVPVAEKRPIGTLSAADEGRLVTVQGTIRWAEAFSAGYRLRLEDETGSVLILLWQDLYQALPDPSALQTDAQLEITGTVALYRNTLEVIPSRPRDVVLRTAAPSAHVLSLGALAEAPLGATVTVEGVVVEARSFQKGFRLTVDDGTGQAILLLWLGVYDELPDPISLREGARVRATGRLETYQGQQEVVPEQGADVAIIQPAEPPLRREIASITRADRGARVTIEGTITRSEPFSQGYRVWVGDGSGEILVLLWENIYQRVKGREHLIPGVQVRVTGVVEEYQGILEIVPPLPGDVTVPRGP